MNQLMQFANIQTIFPHVTFTLMDWKIVIFDKIVSEPIFVSGNKFMNEIKKENYNFINGLFM